MESVCSKQTSKSFTGNAPATTASRSKACSTAFVDAKRQAIRRVPNGPPCTLPRFAALHHRVACEISASEIEEQLKGVTASVHNAFLRYIRAVFNFGIRRGWCDENPVKRIEMHSLKMRKEILTNAMSQRY